jgi:hypothetical protein
MLSYSTNPPRKFRPRGICVMRTFILLLLTTALIYPSKSDAQAVYYDWPAAAI